MRKPRPTPWQVTLAGAFHILYSQAHTINQEKAKEYFRHCQKPHCRLERFLDKMAGRQIFEQQ
jgi:hypothetical protein